MWAKPNVLSVLLVVRTSRTMRSSPLPTTNHVTSCGPKTIHVLAYPLPPGDRYGLHRFLRAVVCHTVKVHRAGAMRHVVIVIVEAQPCQRETQGVAKVANNAFSVDNWDPTFPVNGQLSGVVEVSGHTVAEHDSVEISILVQLGV